jgi:DNA-binding IclR family transcriptional regulator
MQADPFIMRKTLDFQSLKANLNTIRNEGYAVSSDELIMGFMCACAPIKNYLLPSVLIVVGPDVRMKTKIKDIIHEIVGAAATISNNLQKYQGI